MCAKSCVNDRYCYERFTSKHLFGSHIAEENIRQVRRAVLLPQQPLVLCCAGRCCRNSGGLYILCICVLTYEQMLEMGLGCSVWVFLNALYKHLMCCLTVIGAGFRHVCSRCCRAQSRVTPAASGSTRSTSNASAGPMPTPSPQSAQIRRALPSAPPIALMPLPFRPER